MSLSLSFFITHYHCHCEFLSRRKNKDVRRANVWESRISNLNTGQSRCSHATVQKRHFVVWIVVTSLSTLSTLSWFASVHLLLPPSCAIQSHTGNFNGERKEPWGTANVIWSYSLKGRKNSLEPVCCWVFFTSVDPGFQTRQRVPLCGCGQYVFSEDIKGP